MTEAEMARRVLALERQVAGRGAAGSPGVSTAFGAGSTAYRDRFPVILTSAFDADEGYEWARLVLRRSGTAPSVVEADTPQTGGYAFTPDNNESLSVGTRGWLEADPNAGGWIFLPAAEVGGGPCGGGCGSLVGLATTATLKLSLVCATGSFAAIDTDQFAAVYAFGAAGVWTFKEWDAGTSAWVNATINWVGSSGTVVFTWNGTARPTLTLGGTSVTEMCLQGDGTFAAGPRNGINGSGAYTPADDCESNELVLKVECSCTPIDGFTGDGYYCVLAAADDCGVDAATCVYLTTDDGSACDATIQICGERHDTEEDCEAICTPAAVAAPCQSIDFSTGTMNATVANQMGDCVCAVTATPNGIGVDSFSLAVNTIAGCGAAGNGGGSVTCSGGQYTLSDTLGGTVSIIAFTASPFSITYRISWTGAGSSPCTGSVDVTVTWTP